MVHKGSGEAVVYRGLHDVGGAGQQTTSPTDEKPSWHLFEYVSREATYPLLVEMKRVEYLDRQYVTLPAHSPGGRPGPIQRPWIWRIDHQRSAALWRLAAPSGERHPPYWIWKRADLALGDVALQWAVTKGLRVADEVAANGGWGNGAWEEHYYRRFSTRYPARAQPLEDYRIVPVNQPAPAWRCCAGPQVSAGNHTIHSNFPVWVNEADGSALTRMRPTSSEAPPLVAFVSEGEVETYPVYVVDEPDYVDEKVASPMLTLSPTWAIYSLTHPTHRATIKDGPLPDANGLPVWRGPDLSEYLHTRRITDVATHFLPFCTGFEARACEAGVRQGDVGRVRAGPATMLMIWWGTIETRLRLRVPSDTDQSDWLRFF